MDGNKIALLDVGQISEPASKLIEAVRAAVGVVYEPTRIRRQATAEADAALILTKSNLKIEGLQRRAAERLISRELRRQQNIEQITLKAIEELPAAVADEKVDTDWIIQFFDNCQDITNDEMQAIWARLLAGEVAQPGSFSPRTLATLKVMRSEDAVLFERVCAFVWDTGDELIPILLRPRGSFIPEDTPSLSFVELMHLASMGVLTSAGIADVYVTGITQIDYFGKQHHLPSLGEQGVPVGKAVFTEAGRDLARIVKGQPDEYYRTCVLRYWRQDEITVDEA